MTPLAGNRALLTWDRSSDHDVYYAVLDSAGNFAVTITNLTGDGTNRYDYSPEAVQLSDGRAPVALADR